MVNRTTIKVNSAVPSQTQGQKPDHDFPCIKTLSDYCHMDGLFIKFRTLRVFFKMLEACKTKYGEHV